MSRTTPIVIQLKKRTAPGATPPTEDADAGAPPVGEDPPPPPPQDGRDKSSSSSPRRDRQGGRTKEDGTVVGSFSSIDSLMDLSSLGALFRKLHEEVEGFARRESLKLFEQEKRNRQAESNFKDAFNLARNFLEEFAPDGGLPEPVDEGSDGGDSASGDDDQGSEAPPRRRRKPGAKMEFETEQEQLTKKLLPQLVRFVTEDQRALQDAAELLTFFVQRHFPDNKELEDLAQRPSPEKILKGLLGALEKELKELQPRPGGKEEKESDLEDDREERDRTDRGEGSVEKERRYREERDGRYRDDRDRDGRDRGRDGGREMRDGRDNRGREDRRGDDRRFDDRRGDRDRGGRPDPRGDRRGGGRGDRRGDDRGGRERPGEHGGHRDHRRDHGDTRGKGDGRGRGRSRSRDARR